MWIRTVPDGAADGDVTEVASAELQALYEQGRDPENGRVDAILQVHGLHPGGLAAHLTVYRAAMRGTPGLRKVDRELIAVVVSQANHCTY